MGTQRFHGLDVLRAAAMLMGVVMHAILPFVDPEVFDELASGAAQPEVAAFWPALMFWIHQWRMPLFFVLAGFFAAMVIERRGPGYFARDRSVRIFGTMLFFMTAFWALLDIPWPELHHLWFLWHLSLFCWAAALGQWLGIGRALRPALWLFDRPWRLGLLVFPMIGLVTFTKSDLLFHRIPEFFPEIEPLGFLYYWFFFAIGLGLWARHGLLEGLADWRVWAGLVAFGGALGVFGTFLLFAGVELLWIIIPGVAAVQLCFIFGFFGLGLGLVRRAHPWVTFLTESAYAVYIFHLYPVLWFATFFASLGWGAGLSILAAIAATTGFCLVLYVILVRYTPLDWLLAGYRKARFRLGRPILRKAESRP
ncbi:MAG: acyltransferase family protein [Pseudomonadota bacterium]